MSGLEYYDSNPSIVPSWLRRLQLGGHIGRVIPGGGIPGVTTGTFTGRDIVLEPDKVDIVPSRIKSLGQPDEVAETPTLRRPEDERLLEAGRPDLDIVPSRIRDFGREPSALELYRAEISRPMPRYKPGLREIIPQAILGAGLGYAMGERGNYTVAPEIVSRNLLAPFEREMGMRQMRLGELGNLARLEEFEAERPERQARRKYWEAQAGAIEEGRRYAKPTDTHIASYVNNQGQEVLVMKRPDGEIYEKPLGKVRQTPEALSDFEAAFQREHNRLPTATELGNYQRSIREHPEKPDMTETIEATAGDYLEEANGDANQALTQLEKDIRDPKASPKLRRYAAQIRQRIRERVRPGAKRDRLGEILGVQP